MVFLDTGSVQLSSLVSLPIKFLFGDVTKSLKKVSLDIKIFMPSSFQVIEGAFNAVKAPPLDASRDESTFETI